jgi:hypothetical protein
MADTNDLPGVTKMDDPQLGALYRDDEAPASFQPSLGSACFIRRTVNNQSIRLVPGTLTNFLKDRYGYLKFNASGPAVGLILSKQGASGSGQNCFSGIRALHKTAAAASSLRLPVFPPFCG